jgi:hypothetical protein
LGPGIFDKDYTGKEAIKNPMLYASKPFDNFFRREQEKRLAEACRMLPNPESQIIRIAPITPASEPISYISSLCQKQTDIEKMRAWGDKYCNGKIPNQCLLNENGEKIGTSDRQEAIEAAKNAFGIERTAQATAKNDAQRIAESKNGESPDSQKPQNPNRSLLRTATIKKEPVDTNAAKTKVSLREKIRNRLGAIHL